MTMQDALTANQNWTLLGILGVTFVAVITLGRSVVLWFLDRVKEKDAQMLEQGKRFAESSEKSAQFVGENTQVLMRLKDSHDELREKIDDLPRLTADEIQRRKVV